MLMNRINKILFLFFLLIFSETNIAIAQGSDITQYSFSDRLNILIAIIILLGFIGFYLYRISKGKKMFIRPISGLMALDEAVGRATEMGKPVLFVPGITEIDDIQTLAGLSILGYVASKTAEYDTSILVPCCTSVVMSTAQEVVKESYIREGRADSYVKDNICYLTNEEFSFTAAVDGMMMRERTAANFFIGNFYAESLILAETGSSTGAIQIAGTAQASQIPFFVASCDYTLIGEELYAASAYLSNDPQQIGSLKGQDTAKILIITVLVTGCLFQTLLQFENLKDYFPLFNNFINWFTVK